MHYITGTSIDSSTLQSTIATISSGYTTHSKEVGSGDSRMKNRGGGAQPALGEPGHVLPENFWEFSAH